jgi:SH3-like domain-containing protein
VVRFKSSPERGGEPSGGWWREATVSGGTFAILAYLLATPAAAQDKQPPYWASIASGQALTHTGPGKNYPNVWLYQRRDLPIRVVKKYDNWRLIQDPDGAQGWMLVRLLSDRRTAIVKPGDPRPVRVDRNDSAKIRYLAQQGVVGHISKCHDGWCRIEIGNRNGYIRTSDIWGVNDGEVVG